MIHSGLPRRARPRGPALRRPADGRPRRDTPAAVGGLAGGNSVEHDDLHRLDRRGPAGPGITTIVVSNDDAGTITFRVNVPNRPQFDNNTMPLLMWIDSDSNQATGDPQSLGADYSIQSPRRRVTPFKWDGTTFSLAASQSSLSYSWAGGATMRINASDLSNTRKLNFEVIVLTGLVIDPTTGAIDDTNAHADAAHRRASIPTT